MAAGRGFLRILLNSAVGLSLALCVATGGLWVRRTVYSDRLIWETRGEYFPVRDRREDGYAHRGLDAWTDPGRITAEWGLIESSDPFGRFEHITTPAAGAAALSGDSFWGRMGFARDP